MFRVTSRPGNGASDLDTALIAKYRPDKRCVGVSPHHPEGWGDIAAECVQAWRTKQRLEER